MDPVSGVVAAKIVDVLFSAFEAKIARDELVAKVQAAFPNGGTIAQIGDYVEQMVEEKLAHLKKPDRSSA